MHNLKFSNNSINYSPSEFAYNEFRGELSVSITCDSIMRFYTV